MPKLSTIRAILIASCSLAVAASPAQAEHVIKVPGFADFLAVDGKSVWATNDARVERWSPTGKISSVPMSRPCGAMAIYGDSLWIADCQEQALIRIDRKNALKTATIATGIANPKGELNVVAGAGSVWVASDQSGIVSRIDPKTNNVIATIPVSVGTHYLAFGFGALWAVSSEASTVQKIDPATNTVLKTTSLGSSPAFLAAGEGAVWVQEQGDGTVAKIDPESVEVLGRAKVGDVLKYGDIDTGSGKVWLRTTEDQTFVVIDPISLTVTKRLGGAEGSGAIRYTKAGVWTSAHDVQTLTWWPDPKKLAE